MSKAASTTLLAQFSRELELLQQPEFVEPPPPEFQCSLCLGVLLDTLLVRTVLVPSLAFIFGERFWWPAHVDGLGHKDADGAVELDDIVTSARG